MRSASPYRAITRRAAKLIASTSTSSTRTVAQEKPVPVYFIGVGEKLEDLETFSAREFALALLN